MKNQLIQIYLLVCQIYHNQSSLKYQRLSNFKPKFTDEEIITIYLFGQLNEKFNHRQIYDFIREYWVDWFPALPSYQAFNRRLNLLADNFQLLLAHLLQTLQPPENTLSADYLIDSLPVMLACGTRSKRARVAPEIAKTGFSATKQMHFHGVRRGVRLHKQNIGGHQERERRGGTESVPLIVAFGKACELAKQNLAETANNLKKLRDKFEDGVAEKIFDVVFNGNREKRLPHISNISFRRIEGEGLLINLDMQGIAVSTGSACSSGSLEPSPVIRALGRDDELARGAIRFSFGKNNSVEDVEYVLEILPKAVENLRKLSPMSQNAISKC